MKGFIYTWLAVMSITAVVLVWAVWGVVSVHYFKRWPLICAANLFLWATLFMAWVVGGANET